MKNKSVSILASIPTRIMKKKSKKKKKRRYEIKRLVSQIIECKIRTNYKHKYTRTAVQGKPGFISGKSYIVVDGSKLFVIMN